MSVLTLHAKQRRRRSESLEMGSSLQFSDRGSRILPLSSPKMGD